MLLAILSDKEDIYEVAFHLSADIAAFFDPFQGMTGAKVAALTHWKQHVMWKCVPRPVMKFMYHQLGFKVWNAILIGQPGDMNVSRWRPSDVWEKASWAKVILRPSTGIFCEPMQSASSSAAASS